MKQKTIVVIGAGPAGLMAGVAASKDPNNKVIIIEKNMEAGKKLLLTGGGRCNVTNRCGMDQLVKNTITNGKFLFSCLNIFNNEDLIEFLEDNGLKLKLEEGRKVFPITDKAKDVLDVFIKILDDNGVRIWYDSEVQDLIIKENCVEALRLKDNTIIKADSIIFATGGMSYPKTGSTGVGYDILKKYGHTIKEVKPGLVPLEVKEEWIKSLMGISLADTNITCNIINEQKPNKKPKIIKWTGPLIFTHYGISGPAVLNLSSYLNKYIDSSSIEIVIDLIPSITQLELENILIAKDIEKNETILKNLSKILPKNLVLKLLEIIKIDKEKRISDLTKEESNNIIKNIKALKLNLKGLRNINEAIITSGGIPVKEIDPKTMASKLVNGLYFAGEIIDVDALTGGYNLQIAFSTGYVAGFNA